MPIRCRWQFSDKGIDTNIDFISRVIIDVIAHRIGGCMPGTLNGRWRLKSDSSDAWGCAILARLLMLVVSLATHAAWMI